VRKRHMMEGTIKEHNITETSCDEDAYSWRRTITASVLTSGESNIC
jgi:hypothetical protein